MQKSTRAPHIGQGVSGRGRRMAFSKKTAKGRLDKYYRLAKEQGYRARSAFKLVQINKQYEFLQQARVVLDLCAAPGGWCQVAAKYMPKSKIIIGVDLVPIKPISGVISMVNDITTDKCRADLKRELKDWKADVVLHDGAPNVGKSWLQDAYTQSELVLSSLKLATEFLIEGGWFVTKVFRSKDYNSLMWVFSQLFKKVEATKPSSSRDVSAEIFVVCKGYLAPKTIDPRFLDPKSVFTDVDLLTASKTAGKVSLQHPEKTKRHREGYEDGVSVLFKKLDVMEYITASKFIDMLAEANSITFDASDEAVKTILAAPGTTDEIKACCQDLKVLGRRDFKMLLNWRLRMRKLLQLDAEEQPAAPEPVVETTPEEELELLNESMKKKLRREKRKTLERKAKLRMKLQLQMGNADDIAQDVQGDSFFSLKGVSRAVAAAGSIDASNLGALSDSEQDSPDESASECESESERLARMDELCENEYQHTRSMSAVKRASNAEKDALADESDADSDAAAELEELPVGSESLLVDLQRPEEVKAVNAAKVSMWYSNPLFQTMTQLSKELSLHQTEKKTKKKNRQYQEGPLDVIQAEIEPEERPESEPAPRTKKASTRNASKADDAKDGGIVFVKAEKPLEEDFDEAEAKDILNTADGMTLASKLASGNRKRMREELVDESFNRFAFSEKPSDLPTWFIDDESQHNKPNKPITREVADALKMKLKEINDRPIKKILEAKGRNKGRALRRLQGLKKKAEAIAGSEEMTEKSKLEQISKMLKKSTTKREKPQFVVARGLTKGLKGRPNGVKGRYRMVDNRMRKELRAAKRIKNRATKK